MGELVARLGRWIEERVGRVWVVGEISNFSRAASGHCYFTLKDEQGQLRAALFRGNARRLPFEPENGLEVLVYGDLSIYEARGDLQIIVRQLEPRGLGALQLAFEQLRRRLETEGLFDVAHKRDLPELPHRLGIVTSTAGAALRDVLEVSRRRFPSLPLRIAATRVQGIGAEREVAAALAALDAHGEVDAILLVRGGGSLEDLQAFNSEAVARAIAECRVPVIAGVGHETDLTIADLVADARAPTPSAAAELAIPDRAALAADLARRVERLRSAAAQQLARARGDWSQLASALAASAPAKRIEGGRDRLGAARAALTRATGLQLERRRASLAQRVAALDSLSPLAVLGRGYALVRRERDGAIVRTARDAPPGERLAVRAARADLEVRVEASRERDSG